MVVQEQQLQISPKTLSRIGGLLYLIIIALGIVEEVVIRGRIIVWGDPGATAAHLKSMELLWRLGITSDLFMTISTVVLGWILYLLLKPVSRELAFLAVCFNLIAIAVQTACSLQLVEALFPLGNAAYLRAFTPDQLNALTTLSLESHVYGFGIALFLFGPFFLVTGYLIRKSVLFPKPLGILYQVTGVAYLINGLGMIVAPQFADRIFFLIAGPGFVGEASLCLWLLLKGVDAENWTGRRLRNALASA